MEDPWTLLERAPLKLLDLPSFKVTPKTPDHDQPDNATQSREILHTYGEGIPTCSHHTNVSKISRIWGAIFSLFFYQVTLKHGKCTDFNVFFPVVLMVFTGPNQKSD